LRPYSPGGKLNALASLQIGYHQPTASSHRLLRGLPGYLILFAPHAFVPQCQLRASPSPSPLVFLPISTHFTATPKIPQTSPSLQLTRLQRSPRLSPGISHQTWLTTYTPFTPNNSDQRSHPLYYRGCWHRVSRCLFCGYRQINHLFSNLPSPPPKVLYNPQAFFTHAASLDQGHPHCPISPTAASRKSLGRVSVPVWLSIRLDQLQIIALVGLHPTNKLI
jgi:hypothetical protein